MNVPRLVPAVLALVVLGSTAFNVWGQDVPATQPALTRDSFIQEINALGMALSDAVPADELALKDPVKRAEVGRSVIPIVEADKGSSLKSMGPDRGTSLNTLE